MPANHRFWTVTSLLILTAMPLPADTNSAPTPPATNALSTPTVPTPSASPSLYDFTVNSIDGKPVPLAQYKGQVILVVNTASHCGFTSQYNGLEKLYDDYKDKGFTILAFPSNDFGNQEPGSAKEIATFCTNSFHVTFPLFEKIKTKGDGRSPVYQFLTTGHGEPQWNFHKYLVDKTGKVIAEFPSQVGPEDKRIRDAIDAALKG